MLHKSIGILEYSHDNRVVLLVDKELAAFYFSLIPRCMGAQRQYWAPHITIVRGKKEFVTNRMWWGKDAGRPFPFWYDNQLRCDNTYCWLNVYSIQLELIRLRLGLSLPNLFRQEKPRGFSRTFHCTIGNFKND